MSTRVEPIELVDPGFEYEKQPPSPGTEQHAHYDAKIIDVANAGYALALSIDPKLSPTSPRSLQLYLILLVPSMASLSYGFGGSVMNTVNTMEQYRDYFHIDALDLGGVGTTTAIIMGMYTIGSIVGVPFAGPMADQFGRRGGMFFGSLMVAIGALVTTAAKNTRYLLGGNFVLGFGITIATTAASCYVVEMSPPQWRGRLTGLYNTFYSLGSLLCGGMIIAVGLFDGSAAWRVLLAVQVAMGGILATFVVLLPESPRWLLSVGREVEARRILAKYHGNGDENAPLVLLEWKELGEAVKLNASDKRWWDYSDLFSTPNAKRRTVMMVIIGYFAPRGGNSLGYFFPTLFKNIGVQTRERTLMLYFTSTLLGTCGAMVGTSLIDTVGRRTMWFWGTLASTGLFSIVTGCTAKFGVDGADPQGSSVAIAFFFLFGFVYNVVYGPLQVLYPAECLDYTTRAKGMAIYALTGICASLLDIYAGPIALARIHWKYYLAFVAYYIYQCVLIWIFAVETKDRTLEELDEVFEDPHPVRASVLRHEVTIVRKEGRTVIVNPL